METLGQKLRKARETKGWSIDDAATRLKIHPKYFHAIESDDTASLPGSFFYRSFVRQYASLVGLPEKDYALELDAAAQSHLATVTQAQPDSIPSLDYEVPPIPTGQTDSREETKRWVLRLGLLVLVMALSSGGYMLWQRWKSFQDQAQSAEASPAQATSVQPSPAVQQTPPPVVSSAADAAQPGGLSAAAADSQASAGDSNPPASAAQTPPIPPAETIPQPPAQPATTPAAGEVSLSLNAKEDVWVDVWSGEKRLFSNVVKPGQPKNFIAAGALRVRYGNAGGMTVQWNGRETESPGPRGQIRVWEYMPSSYRMVPVPPRTPPVKAAKPPQD